MSLFGDDRYQWRETYFVLFRSENRPLSDVVAAELAQDDRVTLEDVQGDDDGRLESLTLRAPDDFSAMDVTFVTGDEVKEQVDQLVRELARSTLTEEERDKLDQLGECDSRFDLFHFEQVQFSDDGADEILDPGTLLTVLDVLARLCRGVGVDPQSGSLMP